MQIPRPVLALLLCALFALSAYSVLPRNSATSPLICTSAYSYLIGTIPGTPQEYYANDCSGTCVFGYCSSTNQNAGGATGANFSSVSQIALNSIGGTGNLKFAPNTYSYSIGLKIGNSQIFKGSFDFTGAIFNYTGTGRAITINESGYPLLKFEGGTILAAGNAVNSGNAIGLSWNAWNSQIPDLQISNFKAGIGLDFPSGSGSNSAIFDNIQIFNCLVGISADGTANIASNAWPNLNIFVDSTGPANAIAVRISSSAIIQQISFGDFSFANYVSSGTVTMLSIANLNSQWFFNTLTAEAATTGTFVVYNINSSTANGIIEITPSYQISKTNGGIAIAKGNDVNIVSVSSSNILGTNLMANTSFWHWGTLPHAGTINAGGYEGLGYAQLDGLSFSSSYAFDSWRYLFNPAPMVGADYQFAVQSNTSNVNIDMYLLPNDVSKTQQPGGSTGIYFNIAAANTWYLVRLPAQGVLPQNTFYGDVQFDMKTPVGSGHIQVKISDMGIFAAKIS